MSSDRIYYCPCRGINPNCRYCSGSGMVDSPSQARTDWPNRYFTMPKSKKMRARKSAMPTPIETTDLTRESTTIACAVCNKIYKSHGHYVRHMKEYHDTKFAESLLSGIKCSICLEENILFVNAFIDHLLLHHYPTGSHRNPVKCPLCNKMFTTAYGLSAHLNAKHGTMMRPDIPMPL